MKKLLLIAGIILIGYVAVTALLLPQAAAPVAASAGAQEEAAESGYRIGESDGRVAVFRNGELYLRTETQVSSLPKSDRVRLKEGISVNSIKEIKELLQDYCS